MSETNSSAAVALMTGLDVLWAACSGMVSIPVLSACQLSNPCCLATSSWASASLKLAARISGSLRCR